jgi:hypothetical protein
MSNGQDIFSLLNPRPPKGFFGTTGAGISTGLQGLGVSGLGALPQLLASDDSDPADIGLAAFFASLGGPIAQAKADEAQRRERVMSLLPSLLPQMTPESRQKSVNALLGAEGSKGVELQKPVRTPQEQAQFDALAALELQDPTSRKRQAQDLLQLSGMSVEESERKAQTFFEGEIERDRVKRGQELRIHDLNIQNVESEITNRTVRLGLEIDQTRMGALEIMLKDDTVSFPGKMSLFSELLSVGGMSKREARDIAQRSFASQIESEAESILYENLVVNNIPWEKFSQQDKDLVLMAGYKQPVTAEEAARLKTSLSLTAGKHKWKKGEVDAIAALGALQSLERARSLKTSPEETDVQAIKRLFPGESDSIMSLLRSSKVLPGDSVSIKDANAALKDMLDGREVVLGMGGDPTSLDVLIGGQMRILNRLQEESLGVEPGAALTDEQHKQLLSDPQELGNRIILDRIRQPPGSRPTYESREDVLRAMSDSLGADVSRAPEFIAVAQAVSDSVAVVPKIPLPLRLSFRRVANRGGIRIEDIESEFRRRYEEAYIDAPPRADIIASQLLSELERAIEAVPLLPGQRHPQPVTGVKVPRKERRLGPGTRAGGPSLPPLSPLPELAP